MTRQINIGGVPVGGGADVSVQSMTNTPTEDISATIAQIKRLAEAGCDIVRCAVPTSEAAAALKQIKAASPIPVVADIHFDYRLAIAAAENGADKIRVNPGNIGGGADGAGDRLKAVTDVCKARGIPIRIGVNSGSLERDILKKYDDTVSGYNDTVSRSVSKSPAEEGVSRDFAEPPAAGLKARAMADALCESAVRNVKLLADLGFYDVCVSIKSSDARTTFLAYREFAAKMPEIPLHVGVTEAGTEFYGLIKSAAGIGALLLCGIGDTIRVSLTADPVKEVYAGIALLKSLGLRRGGIDYISCPTCGRTKIDLIRLAEDAQAALGETDRKLSAAGKTLTVAVMGCAVNGPGEARHADFGIAGGDGAGLLFAKGEIIGKLPQDELISALVNAVNENILSCAE